MVAVAWGSEVVPANAEEALLLRPLLAHLRNTRRILPTTIVKREFAWSGRRVDLVTLNQSLVTTAYELKVASIQRAVEQAAYNRLSFDRSWVVTTGRPGQPGLLEAKELGVGVMSLQDGRFRVLIAAERQSRTSSIVRTRLLASLRNGA